MCKNKVTAFILTALILLIALVPLFALKGAEFGGSDDAGSQIVESIQGNYEPWFTPVLETLIGGELPGEIESLFFCVQTAFTRESAWGLSPTVLAISPPGRNTKGITRYEPPSVHGRSLCLLGT